MWLVTNFRELGSKFLKCGFLKFECLSGILGCQIIRVKDKKLQRLARSCCHVLVVNFYVKGLRQDYKTFPMWPLINGAANILFIVYHLGSNWAVKSMYHWSANPLIHTNTWYWEHGLMSSPMKFLPENVIDFWVLVISLPISMKMVWPASNHDPLDWYFGLCTGKRTDPVTDLNADGLTSFRPWSIGLKFWALHG